MAGPYLLSVCIPTYNRVSFLKETLQSVLEQWEEDVQIVISDNGSVDGTEEYCRAFVQDRPFISYYRKEKTIPGDVNLQDVVAKAQGVFCWQLTDDDCLERGAIRAVKQLIATHPDLTAVTVDSQPYDFFMRERRKPLIPVRISETKFFNDARLCFCAIGPWLGYWSVHVVNRKRWMETRALGGFEGYEGYQHLFILTHLMKRDSRWMYYAKKLVKSRADNGSFVKEHGIYKRYFIDVMTYRQMARLFFPQDRRTERLTQQGVLSSYLFGQLLSYKLQGLSTVLLWQLLALTFVNFWSYLVFWMKIAPLFLAPRCALKLVQALRRNLRLVR